MTILRYFHTVLLAMLLLPTALLAQTDPGPMNFHFSCNAFAHNDSITLVEFGYQFSEQGLVYPSGESKKTGKLYLRLTVWDSLARETVALDWITANAAPVKGAPDRALIGMKVLALPPGSYRAQILYRDVEDELHSDSIYFPLTVRSFRERHLQLSDIELVTEAYPSEETENLFYKNGHVVLPNVAETVASPMLVLNSYVEIYHADMTPNQEYFLSYAIADIRGNIIQRQEVKRPRPDAPAVVEMNAITVDDLPSGNYHFIITAYNGPIGSATDSAVVVKTITLRNPEIDFALVQSKGGNLLFQADVIDPAYAGLTEHEIDVEFGKVKPIADDDEKRKWDALQGVEAKGRFLTTFWLVRDPTQNTPKNEFRDAYWKRLETAQARYYSSRNPNGWDSDRGRILLHYGEPDAIERHPSDYNMKPYEVWTFTNQGLQFVFVDRSQTNSFDLVHSNAPGEPRFSNWMKEFAMLHRGGASTTSDPFAR